MSAAALSAAAGWLTTTHNFGAFSEDLGPVSCDFKYVNTTEAPVSILTARASCGCTTPRYTREPIAPGDTATVTVTYDPAARPGKFTKYVGVTMSDQSQVEKLYVKGTVVGSPTSVAQRFPVACDSALQLAKGTAMIGEVTKGKLQSLFFKAYNRSAETLTPKIEGLPKYMTYDLVPDTLEPGEDITFILYFHSDRCPLYGFVEDSMTIVSRPGSACKVPVAAIVKEDFSRLTDKDRAKAPAVRLSETTLDFGALATDSSTPVTLTTTLQNTGKSTLKVRRVYSGDPGISATCSRTDIKPGKSATITVTVDPTALRGALLNSRLSIITNDPDHPTTTLRLVGTR